MRSSPLVLALAICAAVGCNQLLGNDKRSLSGDLQGVPDAAPASPPPVREDAASAKDAAVDTGIGSFALDGGPTLNIDSGSEAGLPLICASPDMLAECTPGSIGTETQACGLCMRGMQIRSRTCADTCGWGPYSDWTPCQEAEGACEPNTVQDRVGRCGPCNTGRLVSQSTCTDSCSWGDWSAEVCEEDPLHCTPGDTRQQDDLPCGQRCGVIKQTQTCNAACTWDPSVKSVCMEGACKPGDTRAIEAPCNAEYCNKGVQPQIQACTSKCTWGTPMNNGTCSIPPTVCRPTDLEGTGSRCSPNNPGYRESCRLSTASAAERCTWGPREPYPGC